MNTQPRHPKCRALPVELHPDIHFSVIIPRRGGKSKIFCLWSFLWSKPLLCRFRQSGEIPQSQVLQGFAAFFPVPSRIPPRHSQTTRATNCANPGFLVIEFCARCGQICGHGDFLTTSACGESACIAGVSRDCEDSVFRLEGGTTRSQSRRATNCATPGYSVYLSGWSYAPKSSAIPTSLYPDTFLVYHSCGWKGRENFWFT